MNEFIKVKNKQGSTIYINPRYVSLIEPSGDYYAVWMKREVMLMIPKPELNPYLENKNMIQS